METRSELFVDIRPGARGPKSVRCEPVDNRGTSRGSVNVLVQPENGSLENDGDGILLLPFGQHLKKQLGASFVEFHATE